MSKEELYDIKQSGRVIAQIRVYFSQFGFTNYAHLDVIIPKKHDQSRINMRMVEWFAKKRFTERGTPQHVATITWKEEVLQLCGGCHL
jgi:hypothetical protein